MLVADSSKCLICVPPVHFILQAASFYTDLCRVRSRERSDQFSMPLQAKRKTKFCKRLVREAEIKSVDLCAAFEADRRKLNLIPLFVDPSHA